MAVSRFRYYLALLVGRLTRTRGSECCKNVRSAEKLSFFSRLLCFFSILSIHPLPAEKSGRGLFMNVAMARSLRCLPSTRVVYCGNGLVRWPGLLRCLPSTCVVYCGNGLVRWPGLCGVYRLPVWCIVVTA